MDLVTIGADIGQKVDSTAIIVVECSRRERAAGPWQLPPGTAIESGWDIGRDPGSIETVFTARHVERLPLGTSYPAVAERIADVVRNLRDRHGDPAQPFARWMWLTMDATGLGAPVVDLVRQALADRRLPVQVTAATFTYGDRLDGHIGQAELRVGKGFLVSRLQALLQTDRVRLPDTAEARALAEELLTYEIKVDPDGHDKFGAFKTGSHDDLATALGLACLQDPHWASQRRRAWAG